MAAKKTKPSTKKSSAKAGRAAAGKTTAAGRKKPTQTVASPVPSPRPAPLPLAPRKNVLRASAVLLSINLSPAARLLSLTEEGANDLAALARPYVAPVERSLPATVSPRQIDADLSVDTPPVFVPTQFGGDEWPEDFQWTDRSTELPIELRSKPDGILVRIGNVPDDALVGTDAPIGGDEPTETITACLACGQKNRYMSRGPTVSSLCGACRAPLPIMIECFDCGRTNRVDPERFKQKPACGACGERLELERPRRKRTPKGGYTGALGLIRLSQDDIEPELHYIESANRREGLARRMLRTFCRLVAGYGLGGFTALGVGREGRALLRGLEAEGELGLTDRGDGSVTVRCAGALDPPAQRRLFGRALPAPNPLA